RCLFFIPIPRPPRSTLFPYTTLLRSAEQGASQRWHADLARFGLVETGRERRPSGRVDHTFTYERSDVGFGEGRVRLRLVVSGDRDRKSTRLNSSHDQISYAVFCLKKK